MRAKTTDLGVRRGHVRGVSKRVTVGEITGWWTAFGKGFKGSAGGVLENLSIRTEETTKGRKVQGERVKGEPPARERGTLI